MIGQWDRSFCSQPCAMTGSRSTRKCQGNPHECLITLLYMVSVILYRLPTSFWGAVGTKTRVCHFSPSPPHLETFASENGDL